MSNGGSTKGLSGNRWIRGTAGNSGKNEDKEANKGQVPHINTGWSTSKAVEELKYFGSALTRNNNDCIEVQR
jgi:hypothetical protein